MGKGVSEMFCRGCGDQLNGLATPGCGMVDGNGDPVLFRKAFGARRRDGGRRDDIRTIGDIFMKMKQFL